jgi:hypothetical protein
MTGHKLHTLDMGRGAILPYFDREVGNVGGCSQREATRIRRRHDRAIPQNGPTACDRLPNRDEPDILQILALQELDEQAWLDIRMATHNDVPTGGQQGTELRQKPVEICKVGVPG